MNPYLTIIAGMVFSILIAVSVVFFYLRYQRNLVKQQLKLSEAETLYQKELLHAIIQSQEEERKRIGMDLHDEVGSALSSLRMIIENLKNIDIATDRNNQQNQCKSIIDKVITDVRNISHNLSPLKKGAYGFLDAIEDLVDGINQSKKINVDLVIQPDDAYQHVEDNASLALYRISAELMNNTIKHAKAENITLSFSVKNNILHLDYADDGIGLPNNAIAKKGMGMQNIESRLGMIGASFNILQGSKKGFNASIELPLTLAKNS
jgi:signal transduction histidine kinase